MWYNGKNDSMHKKKKKLSKISDVSSEIINDVIIYIPKGKSIIVIYK